jgi:hypothetical protein
LFPLLQASLAWARWSAIAFAGIHVVPHVAALRSTSGAKKSRSSTRKDFFNNIGQKRAFLTCGFYQNQTSGERYRAAKPWR